MWILFAVCKSGGLPSGSASRASLSASDVEKSVLADDTASIIEFGLVIYVRIISFICFSMSTGWSPTGTFVMPVQTTKFIGLFKTHFEAKIKRNYQASRPVSTWQLGSNRFSGLSDHLILPWKWPAILDVCDQLFRKALELPYFYQWHDQFHSRSLVGLHRNLWKFCF